MVGPTPVSPKDIPGAPSGLAISLAKAKKKNVKDTLRLLCQKIPTQQAYFYEPQGLDLLLLVDMSGITLTDIANCLQLSRIPHNSSHQWTNLDGSTLRTHEYKSKTGKGRVFLAPYQMPYPEYIQSNRTILQEPIEHCPPGDLTDYIQGCRFYTYEALNLKIASQYEYMLKVDLDIEFNASLPFNLLHDLKMKGAVLGHTAEYPEGSLTCTHGFKEVIRTFTEHFGTNKNASSWATEAQWKAPCSAGIPDFDMGLDKWYTNLIAFRTDFFQSEPVRAFGQSMNEFYPGVFRYRWTDQIFFHHAMGMFLGPDFRDFVADYTDLRCFRYETCWFFWAGQWADDSNFCQKGGYFFHSKVLYKFEAYDGTFPDVVAPLSETPFVNHYQHNCSNLPE